MEKIWKIKKKGNVLDVINPKKVLNKMEEQDKKEREQDNQRIYEESIRIVLSIEPLAPKIDANLMVLTATRHDGVVHQIVYNKRVFQTVSLKRARRKLIKEIELMTGRLAFIVLKHEN